MDAEAEAWLSDIAGGRRLYATVRDALLPLGHFDVRVTRSQIAFVHRVGFAWLWRPGLWLRHPATELVLSIALPRHERSHRFKQVVQPTPGRWMHHLPVTAADDVDAEVRTWLAEAYDAAG